EATNTARGRGRDSPRWSRKLAVGESSRAIIGEPWETNREGRREAFMLNRIGPSRRISKRHPQSDALQEWAGASPGLVAERNGGSSVWQNKRVPRLWSLA